MHSSRSSTNEACVMTKEGLEQLFVALREASYMLVGPTVREGAILYDTIAGSADLPVGWTEDQDAGRYRLRRRSDRALFGYNVGPHAWKRFLHEPVLKLCRFRKTGTGFVAEPLVAEIPRYAFIGVRSCDLHAIAIQDRVLTGGDHRDPHYAARRRDAFIMVVQCAQAAHTCFCTSMGTGPRAERGFDLALSEIIDDARHEFVLEVGSEAGAQLLDHVQHRPATEADWRAALAATETAAAQMHRHMDTSDLPALLYRNVESPHWDHVAERCLACGNCTNSCPTCFCSAVDDVSDLSGTAAERVRRWDSCFTTEFSHLHGGSVRSSIRSRYRQWLTHKLASWHDQFGSSGCVGCGRCITWCPVGIDITEELRSIRADEVVNPRAGGERRGSNHARSG